MKEASILIVEDEAVVALDLQQELESMGYHIVGIAERGHQAIQLVEEHQPELVLMDIMIKGEIDGIQTAERLQQLYSIPVIFLTSFSDIETVQRAATTVAYGYLTKPFQIKELRATIEVALYKARTEYQIREFEQRIKFSEERFRNAFDFAPLGMALVDMHGRLTEVNAALCRLLGYSESELLFNSLQKFSQSLDFDHENKCLQALLSHQVSVVQFENRYSHRNQMQEIWALVNVSLVSEGNKPSFFLYQIQDITNQKETEQQLTQLAYFDPLTGLANRSRLQENLAQMINQARRDQYQLAVVFMDLDHFKNINDSLGHEVGDIVLQEVGQRLTAALRETDCVARLGGDEFVLVIPKIHEFGSTITVMEKVRAAISVPILLAEKELVVTPSLGISVFPIDGNEPQILLRNADSALYAAKAEGRNRFSFFRPELAEQALARLELESELRKAVEHENFFIEYQPIIRLKDNTLIGFEALVRWKRSHGIMEPHQFIPVAEETGLILPIGAWVLKKSCQIAVQWPDHLALHVNFSARQFKEDRFIEAVTYALEESKLEPQRLYLELTEDMMLRSDEGQLARIAKLKALGVNLSIDDYGTGYSSLTYLKRYSPGSIKVDGIFINDLDTDPNCLDIVSATIAMAHKLGIEIVAEGVETEEQVAHLRRLNCDCIQGFLCGRPLSDQATLELIQNQR